MLSLQMCLLPSSHPLLYAHSFLWRSLIPSLYSNRSTGTYPKRRRSSRPLTSFYPTAFRLCRSYGEHVAKIATCTPTLLHRRNLTFSNRPAKIQPDTTIIQEILHQYTQWRQIGERSA